MVSSNLRSICDILHFYDVSCVSFGVWLIIYILNGKSLWIFMGFREWDIMEMMEIIFRNVFCRQFLRQATFTCKTFKKVWLRSFKLNIPFIIARFIVLSTANVFIAQNYLWLSMFCVTVLIWCCSITSRRLKNYFGREKSLLLLLNNFGFGCVLCGVNKCLT